MIYNNTLFLFFWGGEGGGAWRTRARLKMRTRRAIFMSKVCHNSAPKMILGACCGARDHSPFLAKPVSLQYLKKSMGCEIDFMPADKHKNFLQIDSITLDVHIHACPKYLGQEVYNIFAISQEKCKRWSRILPADNCQKFLQSDTIILDVCMPKLPKIKSFLFLCNILRKK